MTANYRLEIDRRVKEAGIKEYKNIVMDLISSIEQELGLGFNYSYGYITKNLHTAENLVQVLADWRAKVKEMVDIIPFTEGETDKGDSSETDTEELLKTQEAILRRDITIDNLRKALLEKESVIHQLQASITDKEIAEEKYTQVIADKEYYKDLAFKSEREVRELSLKINSFEQASQVLLEQTRFLVGELEKINSYKRDIGNCEVSNTRNKLYRGV